MAVPEMPAPLPHSKKPKPKVSSKPKTLSARKDKPAHPTYLQMSTEALASLKERTGSSQYAIAKFIEEKYKGVLPGNFKKLLSVQLRNLVKQSKLVKVKGSYKLSEGLKKAAPKAPKAPKAPAAPKATRVPKVSKLAKASKPKVSKASKSPKAKKAAPALKKVSAKKPTTPKKVIKAKKALAPKLVKAASVTKSPMKAKLVKPKTAKPKRVAKKLK